VTQLYPSLVGCDPPERLLGTWAYSVYALLSLPSRTNKHLFFERAREWEKMMDTWRDTCIACVLNLMECIEGRAHMKCRIARCAAGSGNHVMCTLRHDPSSPRPWSPLIFFLFFLLLLCAMDNMLYASPNSPPFGRRQVPIHTSPRICSKFYYTKPGWSPRAEPLLFIIALGHLSRTHSCCGIKMQKNAGEKKKGDQPTATLSLSDSLSEGHWVATLSSKNSDSVVSHPIYTVLY
jgi:hypothetical protein